MSILAELGIEYHFICFLTCSIAEIMYCSSILNQRHLINWVGVPDHSPEEWQLCAKYVTHQKSLPIQNPNWSCFPRPRDGALPRTRRFGHRPFRRGVASGRSSSMPAQAECLPCPACLLAHAGTSRQKGGMPTLACPRLSAWHAGPSAPANRGLSNNSGGTLRSRVILIGFEQSSEIRHNNTNDF